MIRALLLVDSVPYVKNEIYHHQLLAAFNKRHDVELTFQEVSSISCARICKFDRIISLLKIRTLDANRRHVEAYLNGSPLRIVDYDPWINFIDGSPYRGCYHRIAEAINVERIYVSAKTWADKVFHEDMLPSDFIKLGVLPEYCCFTPWQKRTKEVEFKGTRHTWRVAGHKRLCDAGIPVVWDSAIVKPYDAFLNYLSSVRVWAHSEFNAWTINNQPVSSNALWPKGIEALARGCFVLRDAQEEMFYYDAKKMPALLTFSSEDEAKAIYERLLCLSDKQRDQMTQETIHFISSYEYYDRIVEQLVYQ